MDSTQLAPRLALIAACFCVLAGNRSSLSSEELTLRIGAAALGAGEKTKLAGEMRGVVRSRLDARDGIKATADPHAEWDRPPEGVEPGAWLSFVLAEIRGNLDLLTLRWDQDGAVSFAARRPCIERAYAGVFPYAIPPGAMQIPRNAAIELAAQTGRFLSEERPDAEARPALRIAVEVPEPKGTDAEDAGGLTDNDQGEGPAGLFDKLDEPTVEAISALALAAAWEAGWRPSLRGQGEGARATLTLAGRTQAVKVHCRALVDRTETRHVLHRVPEGEVYPYLLRLFRKLKEWGPRVAEFSKVIPPRHRMEPLPPAHAEGYRVLGWQDGILAVLTRAEKPKLKGLVAATGQPKWTVAEEGRYDSLPDRETRAIVARVGRKHALSRVGFADGSLEEVLEVGGAGRLAVDLEARDAVFVAGRAITTYLAGAKTWEAKVPLAIGMDPLLTKDRVVVGSDDQTVRCFARSSGEQQWTRALEGRPTMGAVLPDDALLVGTREGGLYALAGANGAIQWSLDLADGLLRPPHLAGDRVLIVDGSGSVKLLDPATGKIAAEKRVLGRLIGATPTAGDAGVVAIAARTGRITLLSLPSLEVVAEAHLHARLRRPPLAAWNVPSAWAAVTPEDLEAGVQSDLIQSAFLAVDTDGFVYVLPHPRR